MTACLRVGWSPTRQAVILVGGKGTRLGDLTKEIPKPLLPIDGDRRFLDHLLEQVARQGFDDIILACGHLGEQVVQRYDNQRVGGASVRVVRESAERGTAGALLEVASLLEPAFLVVNGDAFIDCNLRAFDRAADVFDVSSVVAVLQVEDGRRYGGVEHREGKVLAFREKNALAVGKTWINAGVYRLGRDICSAIRSLPCSLEVDVFPQLAEKRLLACVPVSGWFLDIGLPETLATARSELPRLRRRPCAFFDRDGTLNDDDGYTHRPEALRWRPGAREAIRILNDRGYRVIVCTNQAGVAKGRFKEADVHLFHAAMQEDLAESGAFIDAFYYCPYHAEATELAYRADHADRKPKPGMLLNALRDWEVDRSRSFMIGDQMSDLAAAKAAGLLFGRLVDDRPLDALVLDILAEVGSQSEEAK